MIHPGKIATVFCEQVSKALVLNLNSNVCSKANSPPMVQQDPQSISSGTCLVSHLCSDSRNEQHITSWQARWVSKNINKSICTGCVRISSEQHHTAAFYTGIHCSVADKRPQYTYLSYLTTRLRCLQIPTTKPSPHLRAAPPESTTVPPRPPRRPPHQTPTPYIPA